jgi:hypothetical protein
VREGLCPLCPPGVKELPLRFDNITVEATETSYWCVAVEFPEDRDYHMFSMQPILDNAYVVHHIDMYECPDQQGMHWSKSSPQISVQYHTYIDERERERERERE